MKVRPNLRFHRNPEIRSAAISTSPHQRVRKSAQPEQCYTRSDRQPCEQFWLGDAVQAALQAREAFRAEAAAFWQRARTTAARCGSSGGVAQTADAGN